MTHLTPSEYREYFSNPDWYKSFTPEMEHYFRGEKPQDQEALREFNQGKKQLRDLFIKLYQEDAIAFGSSGLDFDKDRKPIDKIIIHHTAGSPEATWEYINIQHLFSLYIPEYLSERREYFGQPLWSNHIRDGKMIFAGYHYLIWEDGHVEHLLTDDQVGWHAGDWEVNLSSVAVCFVGDFSESAPSDAALNAAKEILKGYPDVQVLGHREVIEGTICPGDQFLGDGGWKGKLT